MIKECIMMDGAYVFIEGSYQADNSVWPAAETTLAPTPLGGVEGDERIYPSMLDYT